jgi:6-phosphogluconolactonase
MNDRVQFAPRADIDAIADYVGAVIDGGESKTICVPGGSTPFPIFDALGQRDLDWSGVTLLPNDDRVVPHDHIASNVGRLMTSLGNSGASIIPLEEGMAAPDFDLVWLGMGADGHVASLFPNTNPGMNVPSKVIRLTPDPLPPEAPFDRLSWTMPALVNSKAMMLVIKGAEKRAVLDAALAGENDLPIARLLRALACPMTIFWSEK